MALPYLKVFLTFNCQPFSFEYCCQVVTPNVPDIQVIPPEDEHLRHIIDTTAMYVLDDGCTFEQAVMERGRGNPLFNFLFDLTSREHTYYIWRLYSFAQVRSHSCAYFTTSASCNVYKWCAHRVLCAVQFTNPFFLFASRFESWGLNPHVDAEEVILLVLICMILLVEFVGNLLSSWKP